MADRFWWAAAAGAVPPTPQLQLARAEAEGAALQKRLGTAVAERDHRTAASVRRELL